ncbi:MAG TPA: GTPase [Sulfolobales archaeon]|nr:GTPase [Sulfolobales archaeon]
MPVCLSNEMRNTKIYDPEYIRSTVLRAYRERINISGKIARSTRIARARSIYLAKMDRVFSLLADLISRCARLPRSSSMHPFYAEIALIASENMYDDLIDRCRRVVHIVTSLYRDYRRRIAESEDPAEIETLTREYVGRVLSTVRRGLRGIELLRKAVEEVSRSPCISEEAINIVVCGMPQVGKSTLVSRISTAKPETSPFPFTTKRVIMGHLEIEGRRIAIIDTPGILDRPLEDMNEIEMKAVAAIKNLADLALFLIDPRRGAYYSLAEQLRVLRSVTSLLGMGRIVVLINKVDAASKEEIGEVLEILKSNGYEKIYLISALTGHGLDLLSKELASVKKREV